MVLDGICIGRPRCSFQDPIPCTNQLPSSKARFCKAHDHERFSCAVTTCRQPVTSGFSTCENPEHRLLESNRAARHTAFFQLKHVLARQGILVPENSTDPVDITDEVEQLDGPEKQGPSAIFVEDLAQISCPDKEDQPVKLKAVFGRIRSHAELVFHRPCGIMVRRVTCMRAESLTQVTVSSSFKVLLQ